MAIFYTKTNGPQKSCLDKREDLRWNRTRIRVSGLSRLQVNMADFHKAKDKKGRKWVGYKRMGSRRKKNKEEEIKAV